MKALQRPRPSHRHAGVCHPSRQQGFGLIELMISIALGLFIIGGTIGIYLANVQAFRTNEGLSRIQENLRGSFEVMAKELRQAGGNLCGSTQIANVLNGSASQWSSNWAGGTVVGYDGGDAENEAPAIEFGSETGQRVAGSDAISLLSADIGNSASIVSHDTAAARFELPTGHAFKSGKVVVVCDGQSATLLQLTNVEGAQVSYGGEAASMVPGNCSTALGYPTNCAAGAGTTKAFNTQAMLAELTAATWYVGNNDRGGRSLFRANASASEEIAEGVSDMQIQYLLKEVSSQALDSDWVNASAITDWTTAAAKHVVAVRVTLTLVSSGNIGTNNRPIQRQLIFVANLRSRTK